MIQSISITNYTNDKIKINLREPNDTGFIIAGISGLGPVKANINTMKLVNSDGGLFNSARIDSRNIVVNLIFDETKDIEEMRHLAYKYFPVKKNIIFGVETETRSAEIVGYVETNEVNVFTSKEGCSVSIICPDPYFYSEGRKVTFFNGIEPLFEFPFPPEDSDLLLFSEIISIVERSIEYDGESEVGVNITIDITGPVGDITIYKTSTRDSFKLISSKIATIMGSPIQAGDRILIDTTKGNKSVTFVRNGLTYNILNSVYKNSKWFTLNKGNNSFAFDATEGRDNLIFTISNKTLYEGV